MGCLLKGGGKVKRRQEADPMQLSRRQLFCFLLLEGKWVMGGGKWVMGNVHKTQKGGTFSRKCRFRMPVPIWRDNRGCRVAQQCRRVHNRMRLSTDGRRVLCSPFSKNALAF